MSERLAHALWAYALIAGSAALAITMLRAFGVRVPNPLLGIPFQLIVFRGWMIVGAAIAAALLIVTRPLTRARTLATRDAVSAFVRSPHLRRALTLSVALAFFAVEVGKLAHDAEMREFFRQSGYPGWFHYAVMIVEALCAAALLIPPFTIPAAGLLGVMMTGAIVTHARNGDPFTDSLEALHLLLILASLIVITLASHRQRDAAARAFSLTD